jgi:hypothetical protein
MRKLQLSYLFLAFILATSVSRAMFMQPAYVPVNRLIANTEAFLNEHPKNADANYTLARIHYLAFVNKANIVGVTENAVPPRVAPDWLLGDFSYHARREHAQQSLLNEYGYKSVSEVPKAKRSNFWKGTRLKEEQLKKENWQPKKLPDEVSLSHVSKSILSFKAAMKFEPKNGLYHLGLASLYDQYLDYADKSDRTTHPAALARITRQKTIDLYIDAYRLSINTDLKLKHRPASGLASLVGHEAGKAYVRLMREKGYLSKDEARLVNEVEKNVAQLTHLRHRAITPIIFSTETHASLDDLLAKNVAVSFDLDGNGTAELWPWVKPTTGILVWDPEMEGKIVSGRQLFGNATWWILFRDGYAALDVLDDNRDNWLTHAELDGVAVWFDINSNGKSDDGEVTAIKQLCVRGISTEYKQSPDGILFNSGGIELTNGEVAATYDWVASPIKQK